MTRNEFIENVTTWSELLNVCYDENLGICEDIYADDSRDEILDEMVSDRAGNESWRDMKYLLDDLDDERYDYWIYDDIGEWTGVSDGDGYFDDYKDYVLETMDNYDKWDDEPEEVEEVEDEESEEEIECVELEFSFDELVSESSRLIKPVSEVAENKRIDPKPEDEGEEEFEEFLSMSFDALVF